MYERVKRLLVSRTLLHELVLDVDCGRGTFPKHSIIGIDINKTLLKQCHYDNKILAEATHLPFRDKIFETGVELGCLPYVPDWQNARAEMFRVAKQVYFVEQIRNRKRLHWFPFTTLVHFGFFMFLFSRTIVMKGRNTH